MVVITCLVSMTVAIAAATDSMALLQKFSNVRHRAEGGSEFPLEPAVRQNIEGGNDIEVPKPVKDGYGNGSTSHSLMQMRLADELAVGCLSSRCKPTNASLKNSAARGVEEPLKVKSVKKASSTLKAAKSKILKNVETTSATNPDDYRIYQWNHPLGAGNFGSTIGHGPTPSQKVESVKKASSTLKAAKGKVLKSVEPKPPHKSSAAQPVEERSKVESFKKVSTTLKAGQSKGLKNVEMYVINLDASKDRWKNMAENLGNLGSKFFRFRATTCQDLESSPMKEKTLQQGVSPWIEGLDAHTRCGSIGCWWSHVRLLRKLQTEPGAELVLVLEDDLWFDEGWQDTLIEALQNAPPSWSLLKVCGWGNQRESDRYDRNWVVPTSPAYDRGNMFYAGTCGYFINRTKAASVLSHVMLHQITDIDAAIMVTEQQRNHMTMDDYGIYQWNHLLVSGKFGSTFHDLSPNYGHGDGSTTASTTTMDEGL